MALREAGVAVFAGFPVETFAAQTAVSRNLGHVFGAGKVAQLADDPGGVIRCVAEPSVEVGSHFFGCTQLLGEIVGKGICLLGRGLGLGLLPGFLEVAGEFKCRLNVLALAGLGRCLPAE